MACDPGSLQAIDMAVAKGDKQSLTQFASSPGECGMAAQQALIRTNPSAPAGTPPYNMTQQDPPTGAPGPWQQALASGRAGNIDPGLIAHMAETVDRASTGGVNGGKQIGFFNPNEIGRSQSPTPEGGYPLPTADQPTMDKEHAQQAQRAAATAEASRFHPDPNGPQMWQVAAAQQTGQPLPIPAQAPQAGAPSGPPGINPQAFSPAGANGVPSPGISDQDALMNYFTGDPDSWLNDTGMDFGALYGINPYTDTGLARGLDLYADTMGNKPAYWARQNQDLMGVMPGLEALANPGQAPETGLGYLGKIPEYDELLNTPGKYLDIEGLYDSMFSGIPDQTGNKDSTLAPGAAMNLQAMTPDEQINTVMGAFGTMSPFIAPEASNDINIMLSQAAIDWQQMVDQGDMSYPDFLSFLYSIGAADWM